MIPRETGYTERTPWPQWAAAIFWGALVLTSYALLAGWDTDVAAGLRVPLATFILLFGALLHRAVGGLTVRVDGRGILLNLGTLPLLRRRVAFEEILGIEVVRYRPIREFGGWGIRGWGKKKAWTARGDQAVKLNLTGDRELYVGSDVPRRLAERIRTFGGDRLGTTEAMAP